MTAVSAGVVWFDDTATLGEAVQPDQPEQFFAGRVTISVMVSGISELLFFNKHGGHLQAVSATRQLP